jgi:hypothetical protein
MKELWIGERVIWARPSLIPTAVVPLIFDNDSSVPGTLPLWFASHRGPLLQGPSAKTRADYRMFLTAVIAISCKVF